MLMPKWADDEAANRLMLHTVTQNVSLAEARKVNSYIFKIAEFSICL